MTQQTNVGEFIAGAYYTYCMNASSVLYNQPILIHEPSKNWVMIKGRRKNINRTRKSLEKLGAGVVNIDMAEIDVVATVEISTKTDQGVTAEGTTTCIAECTEANIETRGVDTIRRKALAAMVYVHHNIGDVNVDIEFWAPEFSGTIRDSMAALQAEIQQRFEKVEPKGHIYVRLIEQDEYLDRIRKLAAVACRDTSAKIWNPFYRSLQLLQRAGLINEAMLT